MNTEPSDTKMDDEDSAPVVKPTKRRKAKATKDVEVVAEADVGLGSNDEIRELAELDPVAALLANVPHKARAIAERVFAHMQDPEKRQDISAAEMNINARPRTIHRDYRAQIDFLRGRFYGAGGGKRETERRLRQIAAGKLQVSK